MKILQINKYYYTKGGADSVFFNTIQLLEEHNHVVIPFCIQHSQNITSQWDVFFVEAPEIREIKKLNHKIKSIPRFFMNKDAVNKIESLIQKEHPDIAHIHNMFNGISLSILPILKKYKIPIVITIHDTRLICPSSYFNLRGKKCINCKKNLYINCLLYKCYQDNLPNSLMCAFEMIHKEFLFHYDKYVSQYIFVSNRYRALHTLRHSYFNQKGIILYNFLPKLELITPNIQKGNYLFYYGRITKEKGIQTLIEAMKEFPDVQLIVAGTGPILEKLRKQSPANVSFIGFISGQNLFNYVKNSSFVIVPSEWEENNPLTIIESYAQGKPVIGARIGGIPEIIVEEKTGFIFEPFNLLSLKYCIQKAINLSTEEYVSFSINARNFADTHFNPQQHYHTLINIYSKTIENYENI